jgi:tRNA (Thr-GGU) A37 N-methylase
MTEKPGRKTQTNDPLELRPMGVIRSKIKERSKAPKQGSEGAPDAWIEVLQSGRTSDRWTGSR